jgi:hypothetical protein
MSGVHVITISQNLAFQITQHGVHVFIWSAINLRKMKDNICSLNMMLDLI